MNFERKKVKKFKFFLTFKFVVILKLLISGSYFRRQITCIIRSSFRVEENRVVIFLLYVSKTWTVFLFQRIRFLNPDLILPHTTKKFKILK